jgi:hypothetical protein
MQKQYLESISDIEDKSVELGIPPRGFISNTGLRFYVRPTLRSLALRMGREKANSVTREVISLFSKEPTARDIFLMRLQVDENFRKEQWRKYKSNDTRTPNEQFEHGMTFLYRAFDWRGMTTPEKLTPVLEVALQKLEDTWKNSPDTMAGTALLDLYGYIPNRLNLSQKAMPFTEEFLKFVDQNYTYSQFQKAKKQDFPLTFPWQPSNVPPEKRYLVYGILSERWSRLYSKNNNELRLLIKWKQGLRQYVPSV